MKENWGYVRTGTLYGWEGNVKSLFCNNPVPLSGKDPRRFVQRLLKTPSAPEQLSWSMDPMDPERMPFSRHCFTVIDRPNSPLEQLQVIDICHVPRDTNQQLIFPDGRLDLHTFLSLRDVGHVAYDGGDLVSTYSCLGLQRL